MTTLADFLLARIADDEAQAAKHLSDAERHGWDSYPARVLAECVVKRAVIAYCAPDDDVVQAVNRGELADPALATLAPVIDRSLNKILDHVLRLLALPYADHPDYQQEWKP